VSKKTVIAFLAFWILVFPSASGARDYQLNIQANSKPIRDIAPINGDDRELPYETLERKGVSVSYNLLAGYIGNTYGYTLRLIFRNTGTNQLVVDPKVSLFDADGFAQSSNINNIVKRAYEKKDEVSVNVQVPGQPWYVGKNLRKEKERANDDVMLSWVDSYWLAKSYDIPSGTATSGALFYPIPDVGKLPLRLIVDVNGEKFEFLTNAK
jgi:hypothetical protein